MKTTQLAIFNLKKGDYFKKPRGTQIYQVLRTNHHANSSFIQCFDLSKDGVDGYHEIHKGIAYQVDYFGNSKDIFVDRYGEVFRN